MSYETKRSLTRSDGSTIELSEINNDTGIRLHVENTNTTDHGSPLAEANPNGLADRFVTDVEALFAAAGIGSLRSSIANFMHNHDRNRTAIISPHMETVGLTFFSRPMLGLTSGNLRRDPICSALDIDNPGTIPYAIRCLLDTEYTARNLATAIKCPFFNAKDATLTLLNNARTAITGFPDTITDLYTSPEGQFGETHTTAAGSDQLFGSHEFSITFRDIPTAPVLYLLEFWRRVIDHLYRGTMVAWQQNIDEQKLPYTVSIYRFNLDINRLTIVNHARAIGCFPRSIPWGEIFNQSEGEYYVQGTRTYTIPFACNGVVYNDPLSLIDFNTMMREFAGDSIIDAPTIPIGGLTNFSGLPYIFWDPSAGPQLTYRDV